MMPSRLLFLLNQDRAKVQRNFEYQVLQNKLENSDKNKKIEWWKDKNEPDIKPYSVSKLKNINKYENVISANCNKLLTFF